MPSISRWSVITIGLSLVILVSGTFILGWQWGQQNLSMGRLDKWLTGSWQEEVTTTLSVATATKRLPVLATWHNQPECLSLWTSTTSTDGNRLEGDWSLSEPLECRFVFGPELSTSTIIIKKDVARTVPGFSFPKYVVEIYNEDKNILGQRIKIDPGLSEERDGFSPAYFNLQNDINFDGYRDAFVLDNLGVTNQFGGWWLFNRLTGRFEKNDQLSVLPNPIFKAEGREITTYISNGLAGCLYNKAWLNFLGGRYQIIKREEQAADKKKSGAFLRRIEIFEGSKWRLASSSVHSAQNCY